MEYIGVQLGLNTLENPQNLVGYQLGDRIFLPVALPLPAFARPDMLERKEGKSVVTSSKRTTSVTKIYTTTEPKRMAVKN